MARDYYRDLTLGNLIDTLVNPSKETARALRSIDSINKKNKRIRQGKKMAKATKRKARQAGATAMAIHINKSFRDMMEKQ